MSPLGGMIYLKRKNIASHYFLHSGILHYICMRDVHNFFNFYTLASMYYVHICMSVIWLHFYFYFLYLNLKWRNRMVCTADIHTKWTWYILSSQIIWSMFLSCLIKLHTYVSNPYKNLANIRHYCTTIIYVCFLSLWKFGKYSSLLHHYCIRMFLIPMKVWQISVIIALL